MKLQDLIREKKRSLLKDGNFYQVHFLDLTQEEWIKMDGIKEPISISKFDDIPKPILEKLGVEFIIRLSGLTLMVRIVDYEQIRRKAEADINQLKYPHLHDGL